MADNKNNNGTALMERYRQLKADRSTMETLWGMVEAYQNPLFQGPRKRYSSFSAEKRNQLAHAQMGMGTNPASEWFKYGIADYDLSNDGVAREYLQQRTKAVHHYLRQTNYYDAEIQSKNFRIDYGTAGILVEENNDPEDQDPFFATAFSPLNMVCDINARGYIDTVYYDPQFTNRQLFDRFGDALPDSIKSKVKNEPTARANVLVCIKPRTNRKKNKDGQYFKDNKNKPYASFWIDTETEKVFHESGYEEFPLPTSAWQTLSGRIYGVGPTLEAMDDIVIYNEFLNLSLEAKARQVKPAMAFTNTILHKDGFGAGDNVLVRRMDDVPKPIYTGENIAASDTEIERREKAISDIYFSDLIMLKDVGYNRTSNEVNVKEADRQRILASIQNRQQPFQEQVIKRIDGILERKGLLPEMPDHLKELNIKPIFTNPLTQKANELEIDKLNKMILSLSTLAQLGVPVMDNLDVGNILHDAAAIFDVNVDWVKSKDEIAKAKEAQEQAAQQQMMVDQGSKLLATAADATAKTQGTGGMVEELMNGGF